MRPKGFNVFFLFCDRRPGCRRIVRVKNSSRLETWSGDCVVQGVSEYESMRSLCQADNRCGPDA